MKKPKPPCESLRSWLRENLGPNCLGPLVGNDYRALAAAVHVLELIAHDPHPSVIDAFGSIVRRMEPPAQRIAYHAIAFVLDWPDRGRIWQEAYLTTPAHGFGRCRHEPRATKGGDL